MDGFGECHLEIVAREDGHLGFELEEEGLKGAVFAVGGLDGSGQDVGLVGAHQG